MIRIVTAGVSRGSAVDLNVTRSVCCTVMMTIGSCLEEFVFNTACA